jgi:hypothetical protein
MHAWPMHAMCPINLLLDMISINTMYLINWLSYHSFTYIYFECSSFCDLCCQWNFHKTHFLCTL